jgi:hypothetical protein
MNRQVISQYGTPTVRRGSDDVSGDGSTRRGGTETKDEYKEKLLKLIPADTVAAYVTLQGVLLSVMNTPDRQGALQGWLWGLMVVIAVFNIFYLQRLQGVKDVKQLALMTIAFFIWVLSIGGPFQYISGYEPFMGSIILGLFTFALPIFYHGVPESQVHGS